MKIIDLLNKIANGEEVPKIIKFRGTLLFYDEDTDYKDNNEQYLFNNKCCINQEELNEEVEILDKLEEKKIPEKLEDFDIQGLEVSGYSMSQAEYLLEDGVKENREMINWILDYLKSKGK